MLRACPGRDRKNLPEPDTSFFIIVKNAGKARGIRRIFCANCNKIQKENSLSAACTAARLEAPGLLPVGKVQAIGENIKTEGDSLMIGEPAPVFHCLKIGKLRLKAWRRAHKQKAERPTGENPGKKMRVCPRKRPRPPGGQFANF